jgi:hypothetical protein
MKLINYTNNAVQIYKICCNDPKIRHIYVGSTTNPIKTKYYHKQSAKTSKAPLYNIINENGGWENWKMEVLEKCICNTYDEVKEKETKWKTTFEEQEKQKLLQQQQLTITSEPVTHTDNTDTQNLHCKYCNKIYTRKDNLTRHQTICKSKEVYECKSQKIQELEQTSQKIQELELQIKELKQNPTVIHNTNTQNNTNNTIINYIAAPPTLPIDSITHPSQNITIIPLGKENLVEFFTPEQQVRILKKMFGSFIHLIEYVHFSGKFKQFANIGITNLKSNIAYLYDEIDKKFNACDQNEAISELISERLQDMENFLENVKSHLTQTEVEKIKQLIEEIEEQKERYKLYVRKLRFMMYNRRHVVKFRFAPMIESEPESSI